MYNYSQNFNSFISMENYKIRKYTITGNGKITVWIITPRLTFIILLGLFYYLWLSYLLIIYYIGECPLVYHCLCAWDWVYLWVTGKGALWRFQFLWVEFVIGEETSAYIIMPLVATSWSWLLSFLDKPLFLFVEPVNLFRCQKPNTIIVFWIVCHTKSFFQRLLNHFIFLCLSKTF